MRVYVLPYQADPGLPQDPVEWPLGVYLDRFGEPVDNAPAGTRVAWFGGDDLTALLAREARERAATQRLPLRRAVFLPRRSTPVAHGRGP